MTADKILFRVAPFIQTIKTPRRGSILFNYGTGRAVVVNGGLEALWQRLRSSDCIHECDEDLVTTREGTERLALFGALEPKLRPREVSRRPVDPARLVSADALYEYVCNTALWRRVGNQRFAGLVAANALATAIAEERIEITPPISKYVLYHSWLPGFTSVVIEEPTSMGPQAIQPEFTRSREPSETSVGGLIERATNAFVAVQNRYELERFLTVVKQLRPKTVVEIGTARGGLLYCLAQLVAEDGLIVSVDLPGGPNCGGQTAIERTVFSSFGGSCRRVECVSGDSHEPRTRASLERILCGRTVDLLVLDGDHSYEGVKRDYAMYADMLGPDGVLALHDICVCEEEWGPESDVARFWSELRASVPHHHSIIDPCGTSRCQKAPEEIRRWGFGLVFSTAESHRCVL